MFTNLKKYAPSKLKAAQLNELISSFAVFFCMDVLLTQNGLDVIEKLLPIFAEQKRMFYVEWTTAKAIEALAQDPTADKRDIAKQAIVRMEFLRKKGLLRYIGNSELASSPEEGLVRCVAKHRSIPTCIVTQDAQLVERLLPLHLLVATKLWLNTGLCPWSNAFNESRLALIERHLLAQSTQ